MLSLTSQLFSDTEKIEFVVFGGEEENVRETVLSYGFKESNIEIKVRESVDNVGDIGREAADYDLVCMAEQHQVVHQILFGDEGERIARNSVNPVLIVRGTNENSG